MHVNYTMTPNTALADSSNKNNDKTTPKLTRVFLRPCRSLQYHTKSHPGLNLPIYVNTLANSSAHVRHYKATPNLTRV